MVETLYIRDDRSLDRLVERLSGAEEIGLDTEFLRERTYYPRLCLLQLATRDTLALVDPLACKDLDALWRILCDGRVVLHAGGQDLEILQRLAGRLPREIFDTQIAAAFLGLGDSIGYARLVESVLGETSPRSEAYTDWSRRPLTPEQQRYALEDVRHLLACADSLHERLQQLERLDWMQEETQRMLEALVQVGEPTEQWRRVSGARGLSGRQLALLREVAAWREHEAMDRDLPRQRVVPDRVLVEIARRAPKSAEQITRLRGLHPREAERSATALVACVQRALVLPEGEWPRWPWVPGLADDPLVDAVAALLEAVLRARAREVELAPRLLAVRADLALLVRHILGGGDGHLAELPLLRGWRRDLVGESLLALLRGDASVRVDASGGALRLSVEETAG